MGQPNIMKLQSTIFHFIFESLLTGPVKVQSLEGNNGQVIKGKRIWDAYHQNT